MQVFELSLVYARNITLSKTFAGHTSARVYGLCLIVERLEINDHQNDKPVE